MSLSENNESYEKNGAPEMPTKDDIMIELEDVYDPELMVNIVDLGLVYDVVINGKTVVVIMTLTSPGCPAGPIIERDVVEHLKLLDGVESAAVQIVWSPPWNPEKMSDEAKLELGYAIF
jgi:metal-sulfur cluster biosynthetic enzyme